MTLKSLPFLIASPIFQFHNPDYCFLGMTHLGHANFPIVLCFKSRYAICKIDLGELHTAQKKSFADAVRLKTYSANIATASAAILSGETIWIVRD